ncbi:MAG TPA: hypothetical protein VES00_05720 [Burkholderiaceae bacterium]|jgi:hypothetical protein|nr:hypothetical protein [Burkholderiaceae bacterium]
MSSESSRDRLAAALGDDAKNVVMERGYSLGFVGVHGQVRLVQFRLSKKGFALDAATDDTQFAATLDEFTAVVTRLLTERWGGIALRAAFDAEGELIERLYETGTLERCDSVDPASPVKKLVKDGERVDARELLVRASARLVENWGLFEQVLEAGGVKRICELIT